MRCLARLRVNPQVQTTGRSDTGEATLSGLPGSGTAKTLPTMGPPQCCSSLPSVAYPLLPGAQPCCAATTWARIRRNSEIRNRRCHSARIGIAAIAPAVLPPGPRGCALRHKHTRAHVRTRPRAHHHSVRIAVRTFALGDARLLREHVHAIVEPAVRGGRACKPMAQNKRVREY